MVAFRYVFWEMVLILASVLIFRSVWLLMDTYGLLSESSILVLLLIVGIITAGVSYHILDQYEKSCKNPRRLI